MGDPAVIVYAVLIGARDTEPLFTLDKPVAVLISLHVRGGFVACLTHDSDLFLLDRRALGQMAFFDLLAFEILFRYEACIYECLFQLISHKVFSSGILRLSSG